MNKLSVGDEDRRTSIRLLVVLFVISLGVRLLFAIPVSVADMPLRGDEGGWLGQSVRMSAIIQQSFQGKPFTESDIDHFYGVGRWLPVYPTIVGLSFLIFGQSVIVARITVTFVSAMTTPLIYLLAAQLYSRKAALFSAGIHIIFPTLVAFAHLLWAETFFIFLILLTIYFAVQISGSHQFYRKVAFTFLTGSTLALGALTRPTIAPALILVPLWVALNLPDWRSRVVLPALMILTWMVLITPWQLLLFEREDRFVFLATTGDLNLFKGNTPSGMTMDDVRVQAAETNEDMNLLMRNLAFQEIQSDPQAFIRRGVRRAFQENWGIDAHVFKHVRRAIYPPLPHIALTLWYLVSLCSILFLTFFAGLGFILDLRPLRNFSNLLLTLILLSHVFPLVMVGGNTRITVVNMALMIPVVGHGILNVTRISNKKNKVLAFGVAMILPLLILLTLDEAFFDVSGYYAPLASKYHMLFGARTRVIDIIAVRSIDNFEGEQIKVEVLTDGYFIDTPQQKELILTPTSSSGESRFILFSYDADAPAEIRIFSAEQSRSVRLFPTHREAWQTWRRTGIPGVEYEWVPMTKTILIPSPNLN